MRREDVPRRELAFPTIGFQIVQSSVRKACPAITPVTMVHLFMDSTAEDLQKRRDFKSIVGDSKPVLFLRPAMCHE